jgi:hypothetical protein
LDGSRCKVKPNNECDFLTLDHLNDLMYI